MRGLGRGRGTCRPDTASCRSRATSPCGEALLLLGLPFALSGSVFWVPVTQLTGVVVRSLRPDYEVRATFKLATLLGGVVAAWVLWVVLGYAAGGPFAALGAAVVAPLCGYVAILWVELAREVKEDTVLFLKLQGRPDVRMRFARMRRELVETFRRLEKRWQGESFPSGGWRQPLGPGG